MKLFLCFFSENVERLFVLKNTLHRSKIVQ